MVGEPVIGTLTLYSVYVRHRENADVIRRGARLQRRLQVTLSAAKLAARGGALHEKDRRDGIYLCIDRRED
jgi:hypothetical protein